MTDDRTDAVRLRFDFTDTLGLPAPLRFTEPDRVIVARTIDEVRPALQAVEAGTREGWYAAGFVAYEAARAFDEALTTKAAGTLPLVWFGLFRGPCDQGQWDRSLRDIGRVDQGPARRDPRDRDQGDRDPTDRDPTDWDSASASASTAASAPVLAPALAWTPDVTREAYQAGIDAVKAAIARGDTYQANYTFRLRADAPPAPPASRGSSAPSARSASRASSASSASLDVFAPAALERLYDDLVRAHRAPYAAALELGRWHVLSLSPELFVRVKGREVVTRPMKGTAARGRWLEEDEAQAAWLAASEKNRAENVMIVDLARNDVGRVAGIGSVRATSLFDVERYPSVWQMVSTVEGTLRPEATLSDVFAALFPAGSITGAPKSSSMRLIAAIEQAPRGAYCGAIGFVTPAGDAIFNVAIRTAVFDRETGRAEYGVGGGITWDSTAADEYAEALSKAAALSAAPAFELLETMRLDAHGYARRARHLARLRESAAYWDVPCHAPEIEAALDAHARAHEIALRAGAAGTARRARLLLSPSGQPRVESTPLAAVPPVPVASGGAASGASSGVAAPGPAAPRPAVLAPAAPGPTAPGVVAPGTIATAPVRAELVPPESVAPELLPSVPSAPLPVALARTPVSRADRFLYHKTTHRAVYDAHRAEHPDAFDVLLWNEDRELTEFTIGNLVVEIGGVRWTPPRHCGLLAGVLRGELLDAGEIHERAIAVDDLAAATRVWLINSVRGWVPVRLIATS